MGNKRNDVYFATLSDSTYLDELKTRVTSFRNTVQSNGMAARWALSLGNYYGVQPDGKVSWRVTEAGEDGELVQMKTNEYASYVKHELTLAIQQRPAGVGKAVNSDVKTLRNSRIGTQLVEYYLSDPSHNFENDYVQATLIALLAGEGFVVQDWDPNAGPEIRPEENDEPIMSGDITQTVYGPWNAARDLGANSSKGLWFTFSKRTLKWDLAATFPAYADAIIEQTNTNAVTSALFADPQTENSDYVEEHYFIHFPCKALPQGRVTRWTADTIFLDAAYPYPCRNVHRVTDQDMIESAVAHTSNYDLLGLEQITDACDSIILNNVSTFGIATIVGPKGGSGGNGIFWKDLGRGLRYIEMEPQQANAIKVLDLCKSPEAVIGFRTMISGKKGEISGINSILRGDPQGALKDASGSAMALLQSQALVYNSNLQRSFYQLLSSGGTGLIEICRANADEERIFRLAGKANALAVKEFKYTKQTLEAISTVVFEPVNPVLQTAGGRMKVADSLLEKGMITSPKRYIEVFTTGNLNVFLNDDVAMQDAILEEGEYLAEGKPVMVILTENHEEHVRGHMATIATPNEKEDPQLVKATLAHIESHTNTWLWLSINNPALLIATGQKVLPAMPPGPGGNLPGSAPTAPNGPGPNAIAQAASPASSEPGQPSLPKPPANPATGEDAPVAPGTAVRQAA